MRRVVPERRETILAYGSDRVGATALLGALNDALEQRGHPRISQEVISDAGTLTQARHAFYNRYALELQDETLPRGVIVLPHILDETQQSGKVVHTPLSIDELCGVHGVPMVRFREEVPEQGPTPAMLVSLDGLAQAIVAKG